MAFRTSVSKRRPCSIEFLHQLLGDIACVGNTEAFKPLQEFQDKLAVIGIAGSKEQRGEPAQGITDDVELEAEKPAHRGFASFGKAFTDLMIEDALILTDFQGSGVHESQAVLLGFIQITNPLQEEDDIRGGLIHQCVKVPVIGDAAKFLGIGA